MSANEGVAGIQLHAFIDDELDEKERAAVLSALEQSKDADKTLSEYRKLKDLIRHAYTSVPEPHRASYAPVSRKPTPLVTGLLLALGCLIGGLFIPSVLPYLKTIGASAPALSASNTVVPSVDAVSADHVLLHITSNDPVAMDAVLTRAEALLSRDSAQYAPHVEVIANASGIDLLRSDLTPFEDRIAQLSLQQVTFIACARRIERLHEQNVAVNLLPAAEYRYTAVERIVAGLRSGASYEVIEI